MKHYLWTLIKKKYLKKWEYKTFKMDHSVPKRVRLWVEMVKDLQSGVAGREWDSSSLDNQLSRKIIPLDQYKRQKGNQLGYSK